MKSLVFASALLLGPTPSFAGNSIADRPAHASFPIQRIEEAIRGLEGSFHRAAATPGFFSMNEVAQADVLQKAGARLGAFFLEGVARLYRGYPIDATKDAVKDLRESAKDLEDAFGDFDKYQTLHQEAQAREAARRVALLMHRGWMDAAGNSPLIAMFRQRLASARWLSPADDRAFALKNLIDQVDEVRSTKYDMDRLEGGLHELRRQLRWIAIDVQNLGGLVVTVKGVCPVRQLFFARFFEPKYAMPSRPTTPWTCAISECLGVEVVGAIAFFGHLKDQAEAQFPRNDRTPPDIAAAARPLDEALRRSNALDELRKQLKACVR